jgi:hypothetical protein
MDIAPVILGWIVSFALLVLWVWLTRRLALRRNRSTSPWMWLAAFPGLFALLMLALLPTRAEEPQTP